MNHLLLAAAALLSLGLAASVLSSQLGESSNARRIVEMLNLAFTPRGCCGRGESSPLYGIVWSFVYFSNVVAAGWLALRGLAVEYDYGLQRSDQIFMGAAFVGASLFLTGAWNPMLAKSYLSSNRVAPWLLWFAAVIVLVAALLCLVGLAIAQPTLEEELEYQLFVGLPFGFLGGWLLVAAALGLEMATASENYQEPRRSDKPFAFFPIVAALGAATFAGVFGEPAVCAPMLLVVCFVDFTWFTAVCGTVAMIGVAVGVVRMIIT